MSSTQNDYGPPVSLDPQWIRLGDGGDTNAPLIANVRRNGMVIGRVVDHEKAAKGEPRYEAQVYRRGDWSSLGMLADAHRAAQVVGEAQP